MSANNGRLRSSADDEPLTAIEQQIVRLVSFALTDSGKGADKLSDQLLAAVVVKLWHIEAALNDLGERIATTSEEVAEVLARACSS
jgi:hypothetical protein